MEDALEDRVVGRQEEVLLSEQVFIDSSDRQAISKASNRGCEYLSQPSKVARRCTQQDGTHVQGPRGVHHYFRLLVCLR